jgi:hypothetical protein
LTKQGPHVSAERPLLGEISSYFHTTLIISRTGLLSRVRVIRPTLIMAKGQILQRSVLAVVTLGLTESRSYYSFKKRSITQTEYEDSTTLTYCRLYWNICYLGSRHASASPDAIVISFIWPGRNMYEYQFYLQSTLHPLCNQLIPRTGRLFLYTTGTILSR